MNACDLPLNCYFGNVMYPGLNEEKYRLSFDIILHKTLLKKLLPKLDIYSFLQKILIFI